MGTVIRTEHPNPQMVRENWINLNGTWEFEIDRANSGEARGLYKAETLSGSINVPFCPESKLSGVTDVDFMDCVWYRRVLDIPAAWTENGRRVLLHVDACDYLSKVWVNGAFVGSHIGGYVGFTFDITKYLKAEGENVVTISAYDDVRSNRQPGGKQSQRYESFGCSYTRTTGIWQTVWLENVAAAYVETTKYYTDIHEGTLTIEALCNGAADGSTLTATASFGGKTVGTATGKVWGKVARLTVKLDELHLWNLGEGANLYDLTLELEGGDCVKSYFGMREVLQRDGKTYLNGKAVYQRLILDQGFYPDGIYTAPCDGELIADIQRSMDMGFNGARLHQKIFEPRFLYHCDRMGYMVWGEHGNWDLDISAPTAWQGFLPEWLEALKRDFNHPSIIGWCPLNETQNNQNPLFVKMLCDMTRAYDNTRLYIDASGWTHVDESLCDVMDIHYYEQDPKIFADTLEKIANGEQIKTYGHITGSHPVFVSEFGGIRWASTENKGWGYGVAPEGEQEFLDRLKGLTDALLDSKEITAFCYTQLTDVEQEVNGLYTYDRVPKFNPATIHAIISRKAPIED